MSFRNRVAAKSAKFPTLGTSITGSVLEIRDTPVPEFENGRPVGFKTNSDGSAFTQVDIEIETAEGERLVFHTGGQMFDAIADALDDFGPDDLVAGHVLTVTYSENGPKNTRGYPAKIYTAKVETPEALQAAQKATRSRK